MKAYVSGVLAAPSLSSSILNTLTATVLFRGSLTFFMPPLTRVSPASRCWPRLQVSWGRVSCLPSSFAWPALSGGSVRESHSIWQVVHCSPPVGPPPSALRGPQHRERPADGLHLWRLLALHFRLRARAPRSAGGGPPGRSLDSTSYLLGRPRSSWATPWPYRFLCPREPLS